MRYNWLRDRTILEQLRIYWDEGKNNNADYFTKHFPPFHHIDQRPKYVQSAHYITKGKAPFLNRLRTVVARVCSYRDRYDVTTTVTSQTTKSTENTRARAFTAKLLYLVNNV